MAAPKCLISKRKLENTARKEQFFLMAAFFSLSNKYHKNFSTCAVGYALISDTQVEIFRNSTGGFCPYYYWAFGLPFSLPFVPCRFLSPFSPPFAIPADSPGIPFFVCIPHQFHIHYFHLSLTFPLLILLSVKLLLKIIDSFSYFPNYLFIRRCPLLIYETGQVLLP